MLELGRDRYRTNVDSLHLVEFASPVRGLVYDLGAGVGSMGIAIAKANPRAKVVLVEIDEDAADVAERNIGELADRVRVMRADVTTLRSGGADLVVCNPPYVPLGKGRTPKEGRTRARMGDVDAFLRATRAVLGRRGRACFVYPTTHLLDFLAGLRARGLEPKRMRLVHAKQAAPARIALVEAQAGKPGGLVIEAPLFER